MNDARVWLTFDLGLQGYYDGLYQFLDSHNAKECADDTAVFQFPFKNDVVKELKQELAKTVTIGKRARIYAVYPKNGRYAGKYLFGHRKAPRWSGYAANSTDEED